MQTAYSLARIWEEKVARDHPELVGHLDAVIETVAKPDHVEPDAIPARTRFYRRSVGPSRWLMAVGPETADGALKMKAAESQDRCIPST